jgi:hypothetical protein
VPGGFAEVWFAIPVAGIVIGVWGVVQRWWPEATPWDIAENLLGDFVTITLPALLTPFVVRRWWFVSPVAYFVAAAFALLALVAVMGVIYNAFAGIELSFATFHVLVFGLPILVVAIPIAVVIGLMRA